ncbi:MAG: hypothetical protein LC640_10770 [Frankia sp.]|nr:hypothetical protein [Frankia sp.]
MTPLAHGVGSRADLPIPVWLALYGAGLAVVISFAALRVLWPQPRLQGAAAGRPVTGWLAGVLDSAAFRAVVRGVVALVAAVAVLGALFGTADTENSLAVYLFYVELWVGLVVVSLLLGPVWRAVNPLRSLHAAAARLAGGDPDSGVIALPTAIGYWPAAASLAAFAWLELVPPWRVEPRVVGVFLVLYAMAHLVAAAVYGAQWFDRCDGFEVYSTLVGQLAPFGRRDDGRLVVRNPLNGLDTIRPAPGLVAVVCVLIGSTAYDGVTRARWWKNAVPADNVLLGTAGLAAAIAIVAGTFIVATRLAARSSELSPAEMPARFVHSVIPIAVGYALAHYFSLLLFEGQRALALASDPFGRGADMFGTATWQTNYTWVSPRVISLAQVGFIVVGHIVGVVAAHDRAVRLFPVRHAVRGQLPLLVVMVAYTVAGVGLLLGA